MSTIFLVGASDVEGSRVEHACASEETALKRYHEVRKSLIADAKGACDGRGHNTPSYTKRWGCYIKMLEEDDTAAMRAEIWETPYIREMELED